MTVVALWSGRSAPGVTTTALALAAAWPQGRRVVMVEADAAGGELVCHHRLWAEPNLVTLAADSRSGVSVDALWASAQVLGELGVRVVAAPPDPRQASAAVAALGRAGIPALNGGHSALDVVVDLGRLDPLGPGAGIAAAAEFSFALARPSLVEAAHVRERATVLGREVGLVAVGSGSWSPAELAEATGTSLVAAVPADARGAEAVMGARGARFLSRSPLPRVMRSLAAELVGAPTAGASEARAPGGPGVALEDMGGRTGAVLDGSGPWA